jgi:hypothetical protein
MAMSRSELLQLRERSEHPPRDRVILLLVPATDSDSAERPAVCAPRVTAGEQHWTVQRPVQCNGDRRFEEMVGTGQATPHGGQRAVGSARPGLFRCEAGRDHVGAVHAPRRRAGSRLVDDLDRDATPESRGG